MAWDGATSFKPVAPENEDCLMPKPAAALRPLHACLLGFVMAGALTVASAGPALAQDDGQESIWTSLGGLFGVGGTPAPDIDYRERPPLVLPPKMTLRNPQQPVAARNAAWPVDPDVEARRKAAAQSKLPVIFLGSEEASAKTPQRELQKDRVAAQRGVSTQSPDNCFSGANNCTRWNPNEGKNLPALPDKLVSGTEPDREILTDPPKGYRLATKTVKATAEPPKPELDENSPRAIYRQKPKTDE